jgi:hypothetical protein
VLRELIHRVSTASDGQARRFGEITDAISCLETLTQQTATASLSCANASEVLAARADETLAAVRRLDLLTDGGDASGGIRTAEPIAAMPAGIGERASHRRLIPCRTRRLQPARGLLWNCTQAVNLDPPVLYRTAPNIASPKHFADAANGAASRKRRTVRGRSRPAVIFVTG